ncbi:MAG: hypothetical protein ACLRQF_18780 [Thomasclavelia ramosa]
MLTARQLLVFKCIVDEFIETAEPVIKSFDDKISIALFKCNHS